MGYQCWDLRGWAKGRREGGERERNSGERKKKILLFTSHIWAMLNYCKQLPRIMVKLLAKAPFMIWPFQFSGTSEQSIAGAGRRTHFNPGLRYPCGICSHLLLQTRRIAHKHDSWKKVGYRFTFNKTSLCLPFRQSKPLSTSIRLLMIH